MDLRRKCGLFAQPAQVRMINVILGCVFLCSYDCVYFKIRSPNTTDSCRGDGTSVFLSCSQHGREEIGFLNHNYRNHNQCNHFNYVPFFVCVCLCVCVSLSVEQLRLCSSGQYEFSCVVVFEYVVIFVLLLVDLATVDGMLDTGSLDASY
jgi:hypothetical protein